VLLSTGDEFGEMHLLPEPLFSLSTDSTFRTSIAGSASTGRIFLGGKDGCLYEFAYKADDGWFGKKAQKINHSTSSLSFLVPSFISAALYEEDAIEQVVVDDSRNALYTRSEKGVLQVFDLGYDGLQLSKVVTLSQAAIVHEASRIAVYVRVFRL
jgi:nuclear pore complex protein Nup155